MLQVLSKWWKGNTVFWQQCNSHPRIDLFCFGCLGTAWEGGLKSRESGEFKNLPDGGRERGGGGNLKTCLMGKPAWKLKQDGQTIWRAWRICNWETWVSKDFDIGLWVLHCTRYIPNVIQGCPASNLQDFFLANMLSLLLEYLIPAWACSTFQIFYFLFKHIKDIICTSRGA